MVNILVVRNTNNQLGDMICALPMFYALKKKFPDSKITLLRAATNYEVNYLQINPYIDDVVIMDRSSLKTTKDFIKKLREKKFDYGIVPSTLETSTTGHIINFLSGAKKRVGISRRDEDINKFAFLLNVKKEFDWNKKNISQAQRALEVIEQIGCTITNEEIENISVELTEESNKIANEFILNNFIEGKPIIGIHPGAGKEDNRWSVNNFAEVVEKLQVKHDAEFLITCGAIDTEEVNKLTDMLTQKKIKFAVENAQNLKILSALMRKLSLYICNDTGTLHLASLNKVNTIGLFGPTSSAEWKPIGSKTVCLQSPTKNINDLKPETVLAEAERILVEQKH